MFQPGPLRGIGAVGRIEAEHIVLPCPPGAACPPGPACPVLAVVLHVLDRAVNNRLAGAVVGTGEFAKEAAQVVTGKPGSKPGQDLRGVRY